MAHGNDGSLVTLDLSLAKRTYFLEHLKRLIRLKVGDVVYEPTFSEQHKSLSFHVPMLKHGDKLTISANQQPVADLDIAHGVLQEGEHHKVYQLAVCETRALGMGLSESGGVLKLLPYDRKARAGFRMDKHAPITDVHTHSTAQITAEGMMRVAEAIDHEASDDVSKGMAYPVELLEKLGVPLQPEQETHKVPSFFFSPTAKQGLACEQQGGVCQAVRIRDLTPAQKKAITAKIQVLGDETMPFGDFDPHMYRFRNPLAKHPGMARRMLMEIAADYARNGVEYAELSTSSMMLSTDWLKEMIATVNDIERDGIQVTMEDVSVVNRKPHLRFLVAIQRNLNPQTTLEYIERIKYLARHPYIVGADLVGYESNKTRDFHWALSHLAQWASVSQGTELTPQSGWDMKRDFVIRVHAGETGKNPENVRDAIAFAKNYGVRVRVAHALNVKLEKSDERDIRRLAQEKDSDGNLRDLIGVELCPDSNQVFLTKPLVHDAPVQARRNLNAPTFLGTDGGGAIATNQRQLAYSAIAAGATLKDLELMRQDERGYIERQARREQKKRLAYDSLYGESADEVFLTGYKQRVSELQAAVQDGLPKTMRKKTPILIGGASGETWKSLSDSERKQIIKSIQLLVHTLDPEKTYFVLGRTKNEGVSNILDQVVKEYNLKHPTRQFQVLARYSGAMNEPTSELPESVDWVHMIPGERSKVSKSMIEFIDAYHGRALFFGGSTFTTEMIEYCHQGGIPFQMFVPSDGMIREKSQTVPDAFQIPLSKSHLDDYATEFMDRLYVSHDAAHGASSSGMLADLVSANVQTLIAQRYEHLNPDVSQDRQRHAIIDLLGETSQTPVIDPAKPSALRPPSR